MGTIDTNLNKDLKPPFIPGTIRKIKLQNFMCHDSFELELGSRVNFIIGPNGSGKSALLTAIVVVLGGRASTTSRARKNSDFVQYGKNFAKITIEIHNYEKIMDKERAFKPDEYGKKIVVEKIIPKDPEQSARLIMKNDKDKRISERKSELDEMLEFFNIQTNNPICILNQEVSKSFLHSKRPEDKFDLFMKATNLEQIESDYNEAKELYKEWDDCNTRKEFSFRLLDNEHLKCREKLNFLMSRYKLQDQSHQLNIELIWALLRDQEVSAEQINKKLADTRHLLTRGDADVQGHKDKIESAELRIQQHQIRVKTCEEERLKSKKKRDDLIANENRVNQSRHDVDRSIEKENHLISRLMSSKASLEKSIASVEKDQSCAENEKRKLEIQQLKREKPEIEAREKTLRQHADQLRRSMTDIKQQVGSAYQQMSSLKSDLSTNEANLRSLLASQQGDLRKFGPHTQRICDEVDRAFEAGRFSKRPYGPIGRYIKLKTPDVSAALEIHLGNFARAFVCDNNADMIALERVFKNVKASSNDAGFREPMIFVRKYMDRFDAKKFMASHELYKTLIDHIEVSETAVYNALLDRASLEQALYIPDYEEAQNIMITPSMIPRNTRMAYTKDRHTLYPRTRDGGFRSVADDRNLNYYFSKCNQELIAAKRQEIEQIKHNIHSAETKCRELSDMDKVQRSEYDATTRELDATMSKLRAIERRLLELETIVADTSNQELSVLEDELEKAMADIHANNVNLETLKAKLADIKRELDDIKIEKEEASKVLKLHSDNLDKVHSDIQSEKDLINRHRDTIEQKKLAMNKAQSDIDDLSKKLDSINAVIANHEASLAGNSRPATIRPTEVVRTEKKKVETQLNVEIEANQDPDELMATLRRRLEEIDQVVSLRDHNMKNFEMTAKSLKARDEGFRILKKIVCGSVSTTFASVMRVMEMEGDLTIYLHDKIENGKVVAKAKTLEMSITIVRSTQRGEALTMSDNNTSSDQPTRRSIRALPDPEDGPSRPKRTRTNNSASSEKENHRVTNTRSLSGGERSFSTVAFVLALWYHCQSPFKLLDEIDVFMDMVTRRMSYNALIRFAHTTDSPGQFIYFSPLELPEVESPENLVRVFEMPRIIRRGVLSLPPNLEEE